MKTAVICAYGKEGTLVVKEAVFRVSKNFSQVQFPVIV